MLSRRLLELRKSKGYSQAQVAMRLGISQGAVSQWEHNVTVPAAEQLLSLADIYGISVDELLGRTLTDEEHDDLWALRERLRSDPDFRLLFDAASRVAPEHVKTAAAMLKALKGEND